MNGLKHQTKDVSVIALLSLLYFYNYLITLRFLGPKKLSLI